MGSYLEHLGFEALRKQAQAYARGLANEIKTHITQEANRTMTDITAALDEHDAEIAQQLQQTAEALANLQTAVDNLSLAESQVAEVQTALDAATAQNDATLARVQAGTAALQSDDPVEPPA